MWTFFSEVFLSCLRKYGSLSQCPLSNLSLKHTFILLPSLIWPDFILVEGFAIFNLFLCGSLSTLSTFFIALILCFYGMFYVFFACYVKHFILINLCHALGGCSASSSGGERVLPEQENQAAAGPDGGEGHSRWRNQGYEGHARGQRAEDQCPAEEGESQCRGNLHHWKDVKVWEQI